MKVMVYTHPNELAGTRFARLAKKHLERMAATPHNTFEGEPVPRKLCHTCGGLGVSTWTGPHAGSCPTCRGFKSVPMNDDELRASYRELRDLACVHLETTPAAFDAAIGTSLPEDATPIMWVQAARRIVACISPRTLARKRPRKKDHKGG